MMGPFSAGLTLAGRQAVAVFVCVCAAVIAVCAAADTLDRTSANMPDPGTGDDLDWLSVFDLD